MRKLLLVLATICISASPARATEVDAILDDLQQKGFNYFWNQVNPTNGLIRDRSSGTYCSIASVGFGLSAICIGIDHGWITRAQGAARVQTTLNTFWTGPQGPEPGTTRMGYKGFFYHFLNGTTGLRDNTGTELSDIDTALLLAGVLDCRQYFNGADPTEVNIRSLASQIYDRVDWTFFHNNAQNGLMFSWKPETGFNTGVWKGYNEMMIMYILAMGSSTHPVPSADWNTYTSTYTYPTLYGQTYVPYGALFTHQYSHCWIDFRNKRDAYMQARNSDYFENSRKATLAQQAYCIAHPGVPPHGGRPQASGYSATLWGLTAGDGPNGYTARGAPDPGPGWFDDGTISPTAVIGSLPFAPEICRPTIQNMYDNYPLLQGTYGLKDAFNLSTNPDWYATDFLGIDEGPIVMMIENYRTASVWLRFMQDPVVQAGMTAAGFVSTVGVEDELALAPPNRLSSSPNPFVSSTQIDFRLARPGPVRLTVHDVTGREVARLVDGWLEAGSHSAILRGDGLASGVYWYRLDAGGSRIGSRGVRVR